MGALASCPHKRGADARPASPRLRQAGAPRETKPANRTRRIAFDEMRTYLGVRRGKKRRSAWIWTAAVDEWDGSRRSSDFEFGRRDAATFLRLLRRLPKAAKYRSDRYEAYSDSAFKEYLCGCRVSALRSACRRRFIARRRAGIRTA